MELLERQRLWVTAMDVSPDWALMKAKCAAVSLYICFACFNMSAREWIFFFFISMGIILLPSLEPGGYF